MKKPPARTYPYKGLSRSDVYTVMHWRDKAKRINTSMPLKTETAAWDEYQLLDSGKGLKFERFGNVTVVRPEFQAMWAPEDVAAWRNADATYTQDGDEGKWDVESQVPEEWTVSYGTIKFSLRFSAFKHTGVFPEQAPNWEAIRKAIKPKAMMLNLFGYTGGATLAGLSVGAEVVHVDASKPAILSAKRNAELSGLSKKPVRWMVDDAPSFVRREGRRERKYDVIVMDPPAFGRGPKNELWKFEDDFLPLLQSCKAILNPGAMLMVNAYSMGFSARVIEQTVQDVFPKAIIECVELTLKEETKRAFLLPLGITIRARL